MNALVCYASHKGNTKRVAEAIAEGLRTTASTLLVAVEAAAGAVTPDIDLLVVGGPTEAHGMTGEMSAFSISCRASTGARSRPSTRGSTGPAGCPARRRIGSRTGSRRSARRRYRARRSSCP